MTIEAAGNDAGPTWRAICDRCGDDILLDTDGEIEDAAEELRDLGWVARPPEVVRFPSGGRGPLRVKYQEHDCPDCR